MKKLLLFLAVFVSANLKVQKLRLTLHVSSSYSSVNSPSKGIEIKL